MREQGENERSASQLYIYHMREIERAGEIERECTYRECVYLYHKKTNNQGNAGLSVSESADVLGFLCTADSRILHRKVKKNNNYNIKQKKTARAVLLAGGQTGFS